MERENFFDYLSEYGKSTCKTASSRELTNKEELKKSESNPIKTSYELLWVDLRNDESPLGTPTSASSPVPVRTW